MGDEPDAEGFVRLGANVADLINYERSELRESLAKEAEHIYRGEFWVKDFEVTQTSTQ